MIKYCPVLGVLYLAKTREVLGASPFYFLIIKLV